MRALFLTLLTIAMFAPTSANADIVLVFDLTMENFVTISATDAFSSATVFGDDENGLFIDNIFAEDSGGQLSDDLASNLPSDLTSNANTPDNTPNISRSGTGLNLFSWTGDEDLNPAVDVGFTEGEVAFSGSVTFEFQNPADYANLVAGSAGGDIFFEAESASDIPGASLIGQYTVLQAVPEPSSLAVIGLGSLLMIARRRR